MVATDWVTGGWLISCLMYSRDFYASNPLGVSGNYDRLSFAPYFLFKDLITIFLFILVLSLFVFFMPNVLGDSENYVMANPMQTPAAIVPEW
jgi:ubiquinol-cytochrome c reductase cytochrome b subunit